MEKIKVLYIIDVFYKLAGAEKNLLDVASMIDKEKYEPIVICLRAGEAIDILRARGVKAFDLKLKRIYTIPAFVKAIQIYRLIKKERVKIVVTYHEGSDFFGGIIALLSGVPVVISSRRDMGYKLNKRHIFSYKIINQLFTKIISVSDSVKEVVRERENTPGANIVTVYNGVETKVFKDMTARAGVKERFGVPDNVPVIGILAALRLVKGHKYFIEAASIVAGEFPEARFLIIGFAEDPAYLEELKAMVSSLKMERNIIFTGEYMNTPEMLSILDISVLSSLNEGFSNTILESMAAGKPVVATNTGGTPEAVTDGVTGILVPPCDPRELANGILRLLRDDKLRVSMGNAGKQRALDRFDIDFMIASNENLYNNLLKNYELKKECGDENKYYCLFRCMLELFKTLMGAGVRYSGIVPLVRRISRSPKIFAYHRISDDIYDPLSMNLSVSMFEAHLRYLKKYYKPISLSKAVDCLESGETLPDNAVVLTFDDGYQDNYANAFPLLKKYDIPATIFLSVESINSNNTLWYDDIASAIYNSDEKILGLKKYGLGVYKTGDCLDKFSASQRIIERMKYMPADKRNAIVAEIKNIMKSEGAGRSRAERLLNWDEINEMKKHGISFGSHGMSHSILTNLTYEEARYEIFESKKVLKEKTGLAVEFFAYPNGGKADFNSEIIRMLNSAGYRGACTLLPGTRKNRSLFSLGRYCVSPGMLSWLPGIFSGNRFESSMTKGLLADIFVKSAFIVHARLRTF